MVVLEDYGKGLNQTVCRRILIGAKALLQGNDHALTIQFDLEGADRTGRRAVDLATIIGVGRLAYAAALDRACAWNRIKPAMAYMCASVVKGEKCSVITTDHQNTPGQPIPLKTQSAADLLKLRCSFEVNHDLAIAEGPTLLIDWLGSRRHTENALKDISIQEFDCHGPS